MSTDDKVAKRQAFLDEHIARAEGARADGVRTLRYWRHPQAEYIDNELRESADALARAATRVDVTTAVDRLEAAAALGACALSDALGGAWRVTDVDDAYAPAPASEAQMRYQARIAKALAARQQHAPGFDSVAGRARGT